MKRSYRFLSKLGTAALVGGTALALPMSGNAVTVTPPATVVNGFVNYQLGSLASEYCPDPNSPCQNIAAEPAIRADKFGNFFGSSENGLGGGTEAWKSIDGGLHYVHLPSPNEVSNSVFPISTAGGDTDLATASAKNEFGIYNVYVASLELSNVAVSTSTDGGHAWQTNDGSAHNIGNDREWIAADGAHKVCISYRDAAGAQIHLDCSYNGGQVPVIGSTFTQPSVAITTDNVPYLGTDFAIGNLMIDQNSNLGDPARNADIVYQTFSSIEPTAEDVACVTLGTCGLHVVWMAVSMDGGRTFTNHVVYDNPNHAVSYGHQFVNVSVDQAGNVYSFFNDNHNLFYSFSTNHGVSWSSPVKVNGPPSNTAIFPWSAAGDAGKVDVVWYGTSYYDGMHAPDAYPTSADWYVYFAQNLHATTVSSTFSQVRASPIVHKGGVCEGGISCTGNRDLYDDFGVAARPTTGLASIIYSDDQFDQFNTAFQTNCTAGQNNSGACDHTSIATQTTGAGIFGGGGGGGGGGCREADGGGDMAGTKTGTAHASFDADGCKDGDVNQVEANDPGAGEHFKSSQVQSVQFDDVAHSVTLSGTGISHGRSVNFQMVAVNNGALPGTVFLTLDDGYTLAGTLINGTITLN
jgi:hypothetical protein